MQIGAIYNGLNFGGGSKIYLDGYQAGYKNGVDNKPRENSFDDNYDATWERTLYDAAYDKGYAQGKTERGKGLWDLKYSSVYEGFRDEFRCNSLYYDYSAGIHYNCVGCDMNCDPGDFSDEDELSKVSEETLKLANDEGMSIPDAMNYMLITENDTL